MRSQASKLSQKKGVVKPSLKTKPPGKKPVSPNKKKLVSKTLVKKIKKTVAKDDPNSKSDGDTAGDKNENPSDSVKAGPSKVNLPSSDILPKKSKKNSKDKKEPIKNSAENKIKKVISKKPPKKAKNKKTSVKPTGKTNTVKNKVTKNVIKKTKAKYSKAKTVVKKGKAIASNQKKKNIPPSKVESEKEETVDSNLNICKEASSHDDTNNTKSDEERENPIRASDLVENTFDKEDKREIQHTLSPSSKTGIDITSVKVSPTKKIDIPKIESERPPKFFTSSRSPRMVDIDVKCLKNSKGNLSVSERFLSMKCETKSDESNKNKSVQNALISQGPEIDVYTFTEKVDSPKSILSDFRSSVSKNVGRVRPIARVKGTVVDKTTDSEKKKYSPHRPIEEVVQQLMANKCTEDVNSSQSSIDLKSNDLKESDDAPKAIVSKSYKMVARKSSVTGKPFSPIKFPDQETSPNSENKSSAKSNSPSKKSPIKMKKEPKISSSDDEFDTSKFSLNKKAFHYSSSDESVNDSNDESKESSESDTSKNKKTKNKRYRKVMDSGKKTTSKELKELSKDSLVDLKEEDVLVLGSEKPSKRRRKLLSMWNGPKKHRMASLNAIAKVHCLYENESRTHMELGLMRTVERAPIPSTSKQPAVSKKKEVKPKEPEKHETTSESEYESKQEKKDDSSESSDDSPPQRTLRGVPGIRSAGKYWDPKSCTSSSEESELESRKNTSPEKKKIVKSTSSSGKSDSDKPPAKMKKTAGVPVKKKRNRTEVVMDLKDMVVQKRMASLNATAILAASYEKRSPKSNKDETTSDSCSDESFSQKTKNGAASGVKSETKIEEPKKEKDIEENALNDRKQKVEVIVNQDTDVTITGVYSTHHHEGFCTVSGMQYRISSTSHTQTTATANCEKEGCPKEDGARYTPLSALSSMQPPADHGHSHPHPVPELGGLSRRAGCSSAFSAPSPSAHHDPGKPTCSLCVDATRIPYGYYQPAGPLIKEGSAEERALARYHLPHHHAPHPPVLPQYGSYYPDFCYGRYYRPPGPYHMPPPQAEGPMGGLGNEPYPPPQYYGTPPPCYQHSPQRIPYVEYRGCPCPLNACPKNVLIGPATGKAPAGGGPDVPSELATPGGAFRAKVRACALDAATDTHGSGKDPPLEPEPPAAADAPHPCPVPAIGGASPKREMFDVHDNLRIASDVRAGEATGPPSPARGSDGACAPQPPFSAPRRARLGKAMARRSLAGDDTNLLMATPPAPPSMHHSDADDDVMAISPPLSVPIDLSSSDERSTPLVDIKKENEGPTFASARKPEAQALREHNSTRTATDGTLVSEPNKPAKRRYSRTKLEIDMKDTQLEEGCKTNGIGEHVKLIKRRKVSGDLTEPPRVETVTKEPKKKTVQPRKTPKSPPVEKKATKRKLETTVGPKAKKIFLESPSEESPRAAIEVQAPNGLPAIKDKEDGSAQKPKIKSALLLDNLIRKNSIDRAPEKEPNPAELFLSPIENIAQNCAKKMLNINNNIVENANTISGVRPDTIAAVSQLIGKKMAYKNACKLEKVNSKVTHNVKSVLKTPTVKSNLKEVRKTLSKCDAKEETKPKSTKETSKPLASTNDEWRDISKDKVTEVSSESKATKRAPKPAIAKPKPKDDAVAAIATTNESQKVTPVRAIKEADTKVESAKTKRCKLVSEIKAKNVEKVIKLLVSKRPVIKTDEATLVVEEACASPVPFSARRSKRRGSRRGRRPLAFTSLPTMELRAPPRWSNGWHWEGEHYLAKVYLNNDSRLDRFARCWPRMWHASGDKVSRGDCVMLRPSTARAEPFVARVASLWENQDDGEMMLSLVWYYRPEHTDSGRLPEDAPDEVFASRHRDANSVACIEDKCYVLTFNEYCRYRKRLKAAEDGVTITPTIVPPLPPSEIHPMFAPNDSKLPPSVSPDLVMFCRKVYDFRSKKIHMPNK